MTGALGMAGSGGRRSGAGVAGPLALALLMALPAAATPLRVSLHGLDDPGPASQAPGSAEPARFVAVEAAEAPPPVQPQGPRATLLRALEDDEGELLFVPTHDLPLHDAGPDQELPRPDDAQGLVHLLAGAGAVVVAPPAPERRLGDFAPTAPDQPDGDAPASPTLETVDLPAAEAEPLPDLPLVDRDGIHRQRLVTVLVVLPLLLAAVVLLWRMDRGRQRRRPHRQPHRGPRVRHG